MRGALWVISGCSGLDVWPLLLTEHTALERDQVSLTPTGSLHVSAEMWTRDNQGCEMPLRSHDSSFPSGPQARQPQAP